MELFEDLKLIEDYEPFTWKDMEEIKGEIIFEMESFYFFIVDHYNEMFIYITREKGNFYEISYYGAFRYFRFKNGAIFGKYTKNKY